MGANSSSNKDNPTETSSSNNKVISLTSNTEVAEEPAEATPQAAKPDVNDGLVPRLETDHQNALMELNETIRDIAYADYEYPFENLVFEGGGAKGQVYVGCLKVLEEVGVKPKRVAGASAGAICAALVAAGYTADQLAEILEEDLDEILIDHSCGLCSLLPNLVRHFGWNPGNKFLLKFGEYLKRKLGNPDITFKELQDATKIDLCVTAVNVNTLSVEYFHRKTSPNMAVRLAVRMSLSIPGIFEAVKVQNSRGQTDIYIDGGLLCNYPIHAYDGWWLSTEKEDAFLHRMQPLSDIHRLMDKKERFGKFNDKTLGFLVYSSMEQDLMQVELDDRIGVDDIQRPEDSKLYKSRADAISSKKKAVKEHKVFIEALDKFMKLVKRVNQGKLKPAQAGSEDGAEHSVDGVIDKSELRDALRVAMRSVYDPAVEACDAVDDADDPGEFTAAHAEYLFGKNPDIDSVFTKLDVDGSGSISFDELLLFIEKNGIDIQSMFHGYGRRELNSVGDYAIGLQDCLLTNVKKMYMEKRDIGRTVGINTDYIETTDFRMADVDRKFCFEQGRKATVAFLKHYVHDNKLIKSVQTSQPQPASQSLFANGGRLLSQSGNPASLSAPTSPTLNPALNPLSSGVDVVEGRVSLPPIRGRAPAPLAPLPSITPNPPQHQTSAHKPSQHQTKSESKKRFEGSSHGPHSTMKGNANEGYRSRSSSGSSGSSESSRR